MYFKVGLLLFLCMGYLSAYSQGSVWEGKPGYGDTSAGEEPDLSMRPNNNIYINLLGDGSLASVNYERLFFINSKHFFVAAGAGAGVNSFVTIHNDNGRKSYTSEEFIMIPHHITLNLGVGSHFIEFGGGGAAMAGPDGQPYLPYIIAGYRIQPRRDNRIHLRIFGSYPLKRIDNFEIIYIPAGLSVGWSF
jgi:hypothetical protein